jgi:hypothetical protein
MVISETGEKHRSKKHKDTDLNIWSSLLISLPRPSLGGSKLEKNNFIMYVCIMKAGGPQISFRKSQIRKFAYVNNLIDLWTFHKCDTLRISICGPNLFVICGRKTSAIPPVHTFSRYKIILKFKLHIKNV